MATREESIDPCLQAMADDMLNTVAKAIAAGELAGVNFSIDPQRVTEDGYVRHKIITFILIAED